MMKKRDKFSKIIIIIFIYSLLATGPYFVINNFGDIPYSSQYRLTYEILKNFIPFLIKISLSSMIIILFKKYSTTKIEQKDEAQNTEIKATRAALIISAVNIVNHIPYILYEIDYRIYSFTNGINSFTIKIINEMSLPTCYMIIVYLNFLDENFKKEFIEILN